MFESMVVIAVLAGQQVSGTVDCRLIKDDAERLACYDSASGGQPGSVAAPVTAKSPQETAPAAPTAQDFGLTEVQRNKKQKILAPVIEMIESRVIALERHRWDDRFVLMLENGQKWAQLDPTPIQRFHIGDAITIRKAAFDSYMARGPSSGSGVRVRRVD